ncbi:energy transducer TonB [Acidicapsa dinghuensis]|uniref:Energy transducer TonB n=1 Tax=Acidicapsa dinghuensis TaxID=2218256 RepID=A0ABW1E9E1_9BACT|nr:energy transducer TonB [Acidicapsa dinghuensis]
MQGFIFRAWKFVAQNRGTVLSAVLHLSVLLFLGTGVIRTAQIAPYRLPGTDKGNTVLVYFSPGSLQAVASENKSKSPDKAKPTSIEKNKTEAPQTHLATPTKADPGVGGAVESGLGEGDITIALESYFPAPQPDLSTMPAGTKGDVVLDAVIDETGKVSKLTLLKGLGAPIDNAVIATVEQWRYTPAKKDGVPVPSERELHFHYERG